MEMKHIKEVFICGIFFLIIDLSLTKSLYKKEIRYSKSLKNAAFKIIFPWNVLIFESEKDILNEYVFFILLVSLWKLLFDVSKMAFQWRRIVWIFHYQTRNKRAIIVHWFFIFSDSLWKCHIKFLRKVFKKYLDTSRTILFLYKSRQNFFRKLLKHFYTSNKFWKILINCSTFFFLLFYISSVV